MRVPDEVGPNQEPTLGYLGLSSNSPKAKQIWRQPEPNWRQQKHTQHQHLKHQHLQPDQRCSQAITPNTTLTPPAPYDTFCNHSLRVSNVIAASEMAIWIVIIACAQRW